MATGTVESPRKADDGQPADQNGGGRAVRPVDGSYPPLTEARERSSEAISEIMTASWNTVTTMVPQAMFRPVATVEAVFDTLEQLLVLQRQVVGQLLELVWSSVDATDLGSRGDQRAAGSPPSTSRRAS